MSKSWGLFLGAAVFFLLQIVFHQFYEIKSLKEEVRLAEKSKQIEQDQCRELMYHLSNMKIENESLAIKEFVAGVTASLKNSRYGEVWHEGYDRGVEVKSFENEIKKDFKETYTTGSN
jgi:hypothetical protein